MSGMVLVREEVEEETKSTSQQGVRLRNLGLEKLRRLLARLEGLQLGWSRLHILENCW